MAFRLFACCIPVRGARRSLIMDLQRGAYHFIPNGLYEILTRHPGEPLAAIQAAYEHRHDEVIAQYFEFLAARDLGFDCEDPAEFPPLDLAWEAPSRITHAIVDFDAASNHDVGRIVGQLDDLGCRALELRFFTPRPLAAIDGVLAAAWESSLRSIDLLLAWSEDLAEEALAALIRTHPRVSRVLVHGAPAMRVNEVPGTPAQIVYRPEPVDSPSCCGQIHPGYFTINIETATEAQRHNSCLNRKVSIDARGEIRNCPSMARSFGNVTEVSLHSAVAQRDFTALWSINKDQIEVCKDCEFRYLCTDCRAYISRPDDLYSKPSKCSYDPYSAEWS